jgi:hypothetical protein
LFELAEFFVAPICIVAVLVGEAAQVELAVAADSVPVLVGGTAYFDPFATDCFVPVLVGKMAQDEPVVTADPVALLDGYLVSLRVVINFGALPLVAVASMTVVVFGLVGVVGLVMVFEFVMVVGLVLLKRLVVVAVMSVLALVDLGHFVNDFGFGHCEKWDTYV